MTEGFICREIKLEFLKVSCAQGISKGRPDKVSQGLALHFYTCRVKLDIPFFSKQIILKTKSIVSLGKLIGLGAVW